MTQAEHDYLNQSTDPTAGRDIGAVCLAFAAGAAATLLIVTPIFVAERVGEVQKSWDADVEAWGAQCDRAYQQGREDQARAQELAREVAP